MPPARFLTAAVLLAAAAGAFYLSRLSFAPIYLVHDEINYSLQAAEIAGTGRDLNGRFLPLYFSEPEFVAGRDPMMIYATALVLKALPLSEVSVRLSTALVGVIDVFLIVLVARALLGSELLGLAAGLILALSPAHFIHSRLALSVLFPLPFVLIWLLLMQRYESDRDPRALAAGAAVLGLGMYAYLASFVMMPIYLALTLLIAYRRSDRPAIIQGLLAFSIVIVPLVLWHVGHPERFGLFSGYQLGGGGEGGLTHPAPALLSLEGVRFRIGEWWSYFNPDYLFISGDSSMTNSTREAGAFPLACVVLIPAGVYRLWKGGPIERLILIGLVTSPLALVLTGTLDLNRYRGLFVLPFGALVASYGLHAMLTARRRAWSIVAALLVISIPFQFWGFYRSYMTDYRARSSTWFGGNLRGAILDVLDRRTDADPVFVSSRIPYAGVYWRFYSQTKGRPVAAVAAADDTFNPVTPVTGSWLVVAAADDRRPAIESAGWSRQSIAAEPSGEMSFLVYRKIK